MLAQLLLDRLADVASGRLFNVAAFKWFEADQGLLDVFGQLIHLANLFNDAAGNFRLKIDRQALQHLGKQQEAPYVYGGNQIGPADAVGVSALVRRKLV